VLATFRPDLAPPLGDKEGPQTSAELWALVFKSFVPPAFLIVLVLGSIFGGWATPTEAAGVGCAGAMLLAWWNKQMNLKMIQDSMWSSALTNAMVFFIIFGATLFSYVFRALGGDEVVEDILKVIGINTGWEVMTFVMLLIFFMGFFFDWIEICLVVLPIFTPILGAADFGGFIEGKKIILLWFAILASVNMQSAFLTPPFGFALFYMKGTVPPSVNMGHIYRGIIPFVIIQMVAVGLCMLFPEIVLYLPREWGFLD
jgi:tripartite ATP-independent transporter DctM subunit